VLELARYGAVNKILLLCGSDISVEEVSILNMITKVLYFVLV
jgi:hypothetical protein